MNRSEECTITEKRDPEKIVREIKRQRRRKFSAEEKIRIVLENLRGEEGNLLGLPGNAFRQFGTERNSLRNSSLSDGSFFQ